MSPSPHACGFAALALTLVLGSASASAQGGFEEFELAAAIAESLHALDDQKGPESTARDLVAHGPACVPILLHVYETGRLPDLEASPLSGSQRRAVDLTLSRLGSDVVVAAVEERVEPEITSARRLALLEALGAVATGRDLALLLRVAASPPEVIRTDTRLARALEDATARAVGRSTGVPVGLAAQLRNAPAEAAIAVVRAIAEVGHPSSFEVLTRLLGMDASMDLIVLPSLGRAGRRTPRPVDETGLGRVRKLLLEEDTLRVCAAIYALGALDDGAAAVDLVDLLEGPDSHVHEAVLWALPRITGLPWKDQPERWRTWVRDEDQWRRLRGEALTLDLLDADPVVVSSALAEISEHRLDRNGLAQMAAKALSHVEAGVRRQACRVLAQLGADAALPPLLEALRDPDKTVVLSAATALHALTGRTLPPEYDAWAESIAAEPRCFAPAN